MTDSPLVTIAVPTFNRADLLERCIESARDQSYPAIEIVVCDNASTDETEAVVTRVLAGHPRVRYVRHAINLGAIANFQAGLDLAAGEYFMWLADDDWLPDHYVERCVDALRSDPDAILANGDAVYFGSGRPMETEPAISLVQHSPIRRVLGYYAWVGLNAAFYGVSTTAARRKATLDGTLGSDWVHMAQLAASGAILRASTTIHRSRAGESSELDRSMTRFARPIARAVAYDIRTDAAYSNLRAPTRWALALACAGVVYWRKGILYWREIVAARVRGTYGGRKSGVAPAGSTG